MNTYLNQAYKAGCAQALHDFTKSANWRGALLGGVKPSGRGSAASLVLGGLGGAAAAPYLNQEDWDESSSLSKAWQRFQGGLLGASSALTGHNRFGLAGTLGGLGVGVGANYGLSTVAPEGESMGARSGRAALEAIKSSMGASLLANSMFRGGGIRNAVDRAANKQITTFAEGQIAATERAGNVNFAELADSFKEAPDAFRLPKRALKEVGVPHTRMSSYKDSKGVTHDIEEVINSLEGLSSSGHLPLRTTTSNKLTEHLRSVKRNPEAYTDYDWKDAQQALSALRGHGLEGASDQEILRKLHQVPNSTVGRYDDLGKQFTKAVGADTHDDMLRHFYDTTSVDELAAKYKNMPREELAAALRSGHISDMADPFYEGLYEKGLMGAVDAGGPGKWIADLRGVKQGPVSKGIDYWLGSPEVAALVKEHGGLHNVPAGKYLASMGKDIGIGSAIALGAAPVGAAYGAVSDALAAEEPWYNRATPYKIVRRDE